MQERNGNMVKPNYHLHFELSSLKHNIGTILQTSIKTGLSLFPKDIELSINFGSVFACNQTADRKC